MSQAPKQANKPKIRTNYSITKLIILVSDKGLVAAMRSIKGPEIYGNCENKQQGKYNIYTKMNFVGES